MTDTEKDFDNEFSQMFLSLKTATKGTKKRKTFERCMEKTEHSFRMLNSIKKSPRYENIKKEIVFYRKVNEGIIANWKRTTAQLNCSKLCSSDWIRNQFIKILDGIQASRYENTNKLIELYRRKREMKSVFVSEKTLTEESLINHLCQIGDDADDEYHMSDEDDKYTPEKLTSTNEHPDDNLSYDYQPHSPKRADASHDEKDDADDEYQGSDEDDDHTHQFVVQNVGTEKLRYQKTEHI